jgi:phospholipase/lecithinase/hemolysin
MGCEDTSMTSRYSALYAFGDSLSDTGNDSIATVGTLPVQPYYETSYGPFGTLNATVFSNGPVWVQNLAAALGLGTVRPSLYSGTGYAYGGAEANPTESGISGVGASAISLDSQLAQFGGAAPSDALYTLSIGTNDVQTILQKAEFDLGKQIEQVGVSVSDTLSFVSSLIDAGARSFLVMDVPDMSKLPVVAKHDTAAEVDLAGRLSNLYNVELNAGLQNLAQARGATIDILPLYSLTDQVVANPSQFGLANVTDPAWTGTYDDPNSGSIVTSDPNSYLFWDEYHPTAHVHQLIADDATAELTTGAPLYPAATVQMADGTAGQNSTQYATTYTGPVASLQNEFIYPGLDGVSLSANGPNMFLKGGAGDDALQTRGGTNVLDGGTGSNFLAGTPYSTDTFFVDARAGVTWSSVLHFHEGDSVAMFGFHAGLSTLTSDPLAGADGYQGVTFHSEVSGAGTGVTASLTLTGIDPSTVTTHCTLSAGTLSPGTSGTVDYLLIQYDH